MTQLSKHFTLEQAEFSETAVRHGLDNTPSAEAVMGLTRLCVEILDPVYEFYGGKVTVTSMNRNLLVNRMVGSKDTSQHIATAGHAACDFKVIGVTPLQVCTDMWSGRMPVKFDQLIHEFGAWTHVSWSLTPRNTLLTIDSQGTRIGLWPVR